MATYFTRRGFVRASAFAAAGLATGGALPASRVAPAWGQSLSTIRVTHLGGPYGALRDLVGLPFEQAQLGKVVYEAEGSGGVLVSKLQAQRDNPPYNIVMQTRSFVLRMGNAGLLSPLSQDEIPSMREVQPAALLQGGFGVAMIIDCFDLMYDSRKVSAPITSWLDLWRPELRGKIALPATPLGGAVTFMLLTVARALGGGERDLEGAYRKFQELKAHVRVFYSDPNQATQLIERGEIIAAPQYSVRIGHVMKANPSIVRATPKEGVIASPYDLGIAKASPNQDVSKRYINFVLSPRIQEALAATLLATPVHRAVRVSETSQRLVMTDFSKLWFIDEDYVAARQREWVDRWVREIQG